MNEEILVECTTCKNRIHITDRHPELLLNSFLRFCSRCKKSRVFNKLIIRELDCNMCTTRHCNSCDKGEINGYIVSEIK